MGLGPDGLISDTTKAGLLAGFHISSGWLPAAPMLMRHDPT
jgi:hypothetical protein